jgi:hypothetical protein
MDPVEIDWALQWLGIGLIAIGISIVGWLLPSPFMQSKALAEG